MDKVPIKLPKAFDGLVVNIYNQTGLGNIAFKQTAGEFIDGKWMVDIYLQKHEPYPRKVDPQKAG